MANDLAPLSYHSVGSGTGNSPTPYLYGQPNVGIAKSLMQWGQYTTFRIYPLNFEEYDHETETDWAQKEIAGAAIYREWVGENNESILLRGHLFPYRIGGMNEMDLFEAQRRAGASNKLTRGDGTSLGWFVVEKIVRQHSQVSVEGVGQMIAFEAAFCRVPVPLGSQYVSTLWGLVEQ